MLFEFCREISETLHSKNLYGRTITVKLKTASFRITTKSRTLDDYIRGIHEMYNVARAIVEEIELKEDIRLVGISISNLTDHPVKQLSLFQNENNQKTNEIDKLVLEINQKLGKDVLKFGIEL